MKTVAQELVDLVSVLKSLGAQDGDVLGITIAGIVDPDGMQHRSSVHLSDIAFERAMRILDSMDAVRVVLVGGGRMAVCVTRGVRYSANLTPGTPLWHRLVDTLQCAEC